MRSDAGGISLAENTDFGRGTGKSPYHGEMTSSDGSLAGLRQRNRREVIEVVRHRGTTSRAEIAKQTGLSTTTVSTLVFDLLADEVLVELNERMPAPGVGRPARLLTFNPRAGGVVGVHLAHDHVRVAVTDLAGEVVATTVVDLDVDHEPLETLAYVAGTVHTMVAGSGLRADGVIGLGVAVSAPVRLRTHELSAGRILPDWKGVDVAGELGRRTGLAVEVGNDANLGAIAEHRFGAAQGVDDLVYVMLSDGVGAGLVLGGQLYEGALGGAGELGHVSIVPDGYVCRCGNRGCLETVAGARALTAPLAPVLGAGTSVADVVDAADEGNAGARRVLADAGTAVGRALLPVCTVLDPALVVLGGDCAGSEALLQAVRDVLARELTPLRREAVPVVTGTLGEDAETLGAVALASRRLGH